MSCSCNAGDIVASHRSVLYAVLSVNFLMFIVEGIAGYLVDSSGLLGDSLDMLADALVYGIAIYAIRHGMQQKITAARISAWMQMLLAGLLFADVIRRTVYGSEPEPSVMMWMSFIALLANVFCLIMLARVRDQGVHMRASWIFTRNDVLINIAVIIAGLLVFYTHSALPDIVIGTLIILVIARDSGTILRDANNEQRQLSSAQG